VRAEFEYVGSELELFARAQVWKSYFRSHLQPYLHGDVLEVGAGIGATARVFTAGSFQRWTCLEPDRQLFTHLAETVGQFPRPERYRLTHGMITDLDPKTLYDAILYIDVLEHIEQDGAEMARAANHLKPSGKLIVLSPAYQFLYSPFDAKIGHYRRYSLPTLRALTPRDCVIKRDFYLDSVGAAASLANRLLLKASLPTAKQITFWDRVLVRLSRIIDPVHFYSFGRSAIIIWSKSE
jgi:hypothetical protein